MRKMLLIAALSGVSALMAAPAVASGENAYVGADLGYGRYEASPNGGTGSISKNKVGGSVFAGYFFNDYVGLDLGYRGFGTVSATDGYGDSLSVKAQAAQLSVIGNIPVAPSFNIYGRLGYASVKVDASATCGGGCGGGFAGLSGSASQTKGAGLLGVGARYAVTPDFGLRAEYDYYQKITYESTVDLKLSVFSIGGDVRF
jgi:opacity protein-like surface antigen